MESKGVNDVPPIQAPGASRELVRRLLEARDEAKEALSGYLGLGESEALVEMLVSKGAVVGLEYVGGDESGDAGDSEGCYQLCTVSATLKSKVQWSKIWTFLKGINVFAFVLLSSRPAVVYQDHYLPFRSHVLLLNCNSSYVQPRPQDVLFPVTLRLSYWVLLNPASSH